MEIIRKSNILHEIIKRHKFKESIGFVPTMGALHDGHISLIKKAREENDIVIVSIFVNPLQFGEGEDYTIYPRTIESDSKICKENGVDILFFPEEASFYNNPHLTTVSVKKISEPLCGRTRPGHFDGVCTVVLKLFNIVMPDNAYFGKKDFQQYSIIKKMVSDLSLDINIIGMPIIREINGLAKSSRNKYLSDDELESSIYINQSLFDSLEKIRNGEKSSDVITRNIKEIINKGKYNKIQYVEILSTDNFLPVKNITNNSLIAVAVFCGKTRLIDNIFISDYL